MLKKLVLLILALCSVEARADFAPPRYSLRLETTNYESWEQQTHRWYGVRSGGVTAYLRDDKKNAQVNVAESVYGLQVNVGFESLGTLYGVFGYEFPAVSPVTFFLATVHLPGGGQRFYGGPIYYYGPHNSQLFFFQDGPKLGSVALRNRLRFDSFNLDADLNYRLDHAHFSPWGWAVEMSLAPVFARLSRVSFKDGVEQERRSVEVGLTASL